MKIALVGLPGSGKSTACSILKTYGFDILEADKVGHSLLLEPSIKKVLHEEFKDMMFENDSIDRRTLAKIVSQDRGALDKLESILHPEMKKRIQEQLRHSKNVVLECPLLTKMGLETEVDEVLYLDVPFGQRFERIKRRGWSGKDLRLRDEAILRNWTLGTYRTVRNSGSPVDLEQTLKRIVNGIMGSRGIFPPFGSTDCEYGHDLSEGKENKIKEETDCEDEFDYLLFTVED